jgi:hypothetical protein
LGKFGTIKKFVKIFFKLTFESSNWTEKKKGRMGIPRTGGYFVAPGNSTCSYISGMPKGIKRAKVQY